MILEEVNGIHSHPQLEKIVADKRSGKDRRVNKVRRKGGDSSYRGPEKRAIKYRRDGNDRRERN